MRFRHRIVGNADLLRSAGNLQHSAPYSRRTQESVMCNPAGCFVVSCCGCVMSHSFQCSYWRQHDCRDSNNNRFIILAPVEVSQHLQQAAAKRLIRPFDKLPAHRAHLFLLSPDPTGRTELRYGYVLILAGVLCSYPWKRWWQAEHRVARPERWLQNRPIVSLLPTRNFSRLCIAPYSVHLHGDS